MGLADGCPLAVANCPSLVCDGRVACGHGGFEGHHGAVIWARVSMQKSIRKGGVPEPNQKERLLDMNSIRILPSEKAPS